MDTIKLIPEISDEHAILSIDFLAGFTIFILALVMVISLVPGILAGLQSENIDYDAVAYRTSVILVEDPGAPDNPPWNLINIEYKDDIQRLGLAVSKDTPNILSRGKVDKFFNNNPDFRFTADDYRKKVIFGDLTYLYNISLKVDGESEIYYAAGGDPVPEFQYGYMRRLVKVKEPSVAEIIFPVYPSPKYSEELNASDKTVSANFSVHIPYEVLINRSVNPAYRIDPQSEQLRIILSNMYSHIGPDIIEDNFTLTKVEIYKPVGGGVSIPLLGSGAFDNDTYSLTINGTQYPANLDGYDGKVRNSEIVMVLYPPLDFSNEITSSLNVNFSFSYEFSGVLSNHTYLTGMHQYDYNPINVTQPELKDAVMEVAIW